MKIYCIEWKKLPPWLDDFALFTSAAKAKKFWDHNIKALRKDKDVAITDASVCLSVYTSSEDDTGIMEAALIADYHKSEDHLQQEGELWEEFLKECKK